ncbi:YibE/F family protein [Arthrobacter tumbae]|uniref:YibE/F family protein n=1 Tax=Arthrobacter tumbae TaxID=163874 RepID=UPI003556B082|nr:putative membrane protein [Arthrobacter tumbae]
MGHSHIHPSDGAAPELNPEQDAALARTRRRANFLLAAILVPLGVITLVALMMLWPSADRSGITVADPLATAPGTSMDVGTVQRVVLEDCPSSQPTVDAGGEAQQCLVAYTQPDAGGSAVPVELNPEIARSGQLEPGDSIRYLNLEGVISGAGTPYIFVDFVRTLPVAALAVLYAVVVVSVARWRGLRAIIGLVGALFVLAQFMLPGLVEGKPPLLLGLVGSVVIMFGVLYFAHGFSARTSTALLGTIFGLAITVLLAAWATGTANLTGVGNDSSTTLITAAPEVSLSGIILCGLIISGLGVLNDVTITQSSAVWELYELAPGTSTRRLFAGAMRIGRDHIASTVYTIAFAYAGAALPLLILVSLQDSSLVTALTSGELVEEVVRTLVGSIGLVLAIPVTTLVAVLVVKAVGQGTGPASSTTQHDDALTPAALAAEEVRDSQAAEAHAGQVPAGTLPSRRELRGQRQG